jgi:hypothetical protein
VVSAAGSHGQRRSSRQVSRTPSPQSPARWHDRLPDGTNEIVGQIALGVSANVVLTKDVRVHAAILSRGAGTHEALL